MLVFLGISTLAVWCCYPIVMLSSLFRLISIHHAVQSYCILDALAKIAVSSLLVQLVFGFKCKDMGSNAALIAQSHDMRNLAQSLSHLLDSTLEKWSESNSDTKDALDACSYTLKDTTFAAQPLIEWNSNKDTY